MEQKGLSKKYIFAFVLLLVFGAVVTSILIMRSNQTDRYFDYQNSLNKDL